MKKKSVVKTQKILGIILLVFGFLLLCFSVYMIKAIGDEYDRSLVTDLSDQNQPITRMYKVLENPSLSEQEKLNIEHMMQAYSALPETSLYSGFNLFLTTIPLSLLFIVLGIMNLLQSAWNNAKN
jgi:hypothetical protein